MTCPQCNGHKIVVYPIEGTSELEVGHCPECSGRITYDEFIGRYCKIVNSENVVEMRKARAKK